VLAWSCSISAKRKHQTPPRGCSEVQQCAPYRSSGRPWNNQHRIDWLGAR
jgi:hypothetical protein